MSSSLRREVDAFVFGDAFVFIGFRQTSDNGRSRIAVESGPPTANSGETVGQRIFGDPTTVVGRLHDFQTIISRQKIDLTVSSVDLLDSVQ